MEKDLIEKVKSILPEIIKNRRKIHSNPELSFKEFETAKFIRKNLDELNIPYTIHSNTGTAGIIGNGDKCVALRADIDALPIHEDTELEYRSKNDGVMHACGHDMHTSMLLGAAKILKEMEKDIPGKIKLIFQPGEEKLPGGAKLMIEDGVLEDPAPEAIFGQHIFPEENIGTVSINEGPVMGSPDELYVTIKGKSTHAAQPHLGADPIVCASNLINLYQTFISRSKDPIESGVVTIAAINGGYATNIIPDEVKLMGTIRSYDKDWRQKVHKLIKEKSIELGKAYSCEVEVEIIEGYPAVVNDPALTQIAKEASIKLIGKGKTRLFEPKMWGEDFAFYGEKIPACFWFVGVKDPQFETMPALHNSKIAPHEDGLIYGTSMLVGAALEYLSS